MINRLPLDLFGGDSSSSSPSVEPAEEFVPAEIEELFESAVVDTEPVSEPLDVDVLLVNCQWCSARFDNDLPNCPECNARHVRIQPPPDDPTEVTCQWCLTTFDVGPDTCPGCNARVVIPGQNVPGEHAVGLDYNSMGMMARRAESSRMLAGMMTVGRLNSLAGGLIGLALFLLDDD